MSDTEAPSWIDFETVNTRPGSYSPLTVRSTAHWQLLLLLLIVLPYLIAWWMTPEGFVFTGALFNPDDVGVYVSAMRQGAEGKWLYHFTYSPEPWQPRLMLSLYLVLGKITALFAEPTIFWLHFWRVILAVITMWALVFWVKTLLPSRSQWQWTAWLLILFGNGISWLAVYFGFYGKLTPDIGMAEWSLILSLFNTPHFALGIGLEVITFTSVVKMTHGATTREGVGWALMAATAAVLATMVYVYHLAIIIMVVGVYMLTLAVQERMIPWRQWLLGAVIIIPLLPFLVYYAFWTNGDPFWTAYTRVDHVVAPPPPLGVLIGMGGLGLLALMGGRWWLKKGFTTLVPVWALVNLAALYLPFVSFSGRFALGLMVPVATLAAIGLEAVLLPAFPHSHLFSRLSATPSATVRRVALILLMPSTLLAILLFVKGPLIQHGFPYYLPKVDVAAAKWLGEHTDESAIVMAYYPMGNYLPRVYAGKVFLGQLDFTTDLDGKLALFEQFWGGSMTAAQQKSFLEEWGITHLFSGSYEERYLGDNITLPGQKVYQNNGVTIFQLPDSG